MTQNLLLTYLLLTPIIGSVLLLFFKKEQKQLIRWFGFAVSLVAFVISLIIYFGFDSANPQFQFIHQVIWIKSLNISYHVGVEDFSLLVLTTFLTPLTLLSTWNALKRI